MCILDLEASGLRPRWSMQLFNGKTHLWIIFVGFIWDLRPCVHCSPWLCLWQSLGQSLIPFSQSFLSRFPGTAENPAEFAVERVKRFPLTSHPSQGRILSCLGIYCAVIPCPSFHTGLSSPFNVLNCCFSISKAGFLWKKIFSGEGDRLPSPELIRVLRGEELIGCFPRAALPFRSKEGNSRVSMEAINHHKYSSCAPVVKRAAASPSLHIWSACAYLHDGLPFPD